MCCESQRAAHKKAAEIPKWADSHTDRSLQHPISLRALHKYIILQVERLGLLQAVRLFRCSVLQGFSNEMAHFNLNQGTASLYNNTIFLKSAQQSNENSPYLSSADAMFQGIFTVSLSIKLKILKLQVINETHLPVFILEMHLKVSPASLAG